MVPKHSVLVNGFEVTEIYTGMQGNMVPTHSVLVNGFEVTEIPRQYCSESFSFY
jgi:ribosomal protein S12